MMRNKQTVIAAIIVLFNAVGIIGFSIPALQPLFLKIVPWYLLLMTVLVMVSHLPLNDRFLLFFLVIYLTGFGAECIGVQKGWLFGHYSYGQTLGLKVLAVPLAIGVNWFLLVYSAGVVMQYSRLRSKFARVVIGAVILVLLDVLIEPVAVKFYYWHWIDGMVPLTNYACWFLVSCGLLYVFESFKFRQQGIVAVVFLVMQFVFFGVLNLVMMGGS